MYEFDPSYTLNTGDLTVTATGSGVHLNRDTALLFEILDPNGNVVNNDSDLSRNQFISGISFDILDTGASVIYADYRSGKSVYFGLSEDENLALFGEYVKDFGIRMKVSNTINSDIFTSEFYLYGNVPQIDTSSISVRDGTENPYAADPQIFDKIQFNLNYTNDFNYINFDRIDIYASTSPLTGVNLQGSGELSLEEINSSEYFVYTHPITLPTEANTVILKPTNLLYDTSYYFALIPYSQLGSGSGYYTTTPYKFASEGYFTGESTIGANEFNLVHGDSIMATDFTTGSLPTTGSTTIDIIERGAYSTVSYISQIIDASGTAMSSDLKIVISESSITGYSGIYLSESAISSNDLATYSIDSDDNYIYLKVTGTYEVPATYKYYKISI